MNPLNYNRYSYVLNNPLKYTDPSGYTYYKFTGDGYEAFEYNPLGGDSRTYQEASRGGINYKASNESHGYYGDWRYDQHTGEFKNTMTGAKFHAVFDHDRYKDFINDVSNSSEYKYVYEGTLMNMGDGIYYNGTISAYRQYDVANSSGGQTLMGGAISFALVASAADGPLPFGEAIGATAIYQAVKKSQGNPNYPGPWCTDRPKNYIPPPVPANNNRNYFPNGNGNDFTKWVIRIGGASVLTKRLYDAFSVDEQFNVAPQDNIYIQPTPFLTPIPDPYKGY